MKWKLDSGEADVFFQLSTLTGQTFCPSIENWNYATEF